MAGAGAEGPIAASNHAAPTAWPPFFFFFVPSCCWAPSKWHAFQAFPLHSHERRVPLRTHCRLTVQGPTVMMPIGGCSLKAVHRLCTIGRNRTRASRGYSSNMHFVGGPGGRESADLHGDNCPCKTGLGPSEPSLCDQLVGLYEAVRSLTVALWGQGRRGVSPWVWRLGESRPLNHQA